MLHIRLDLIVSPFPLCPPCKDAAGCVLAPQSRSPIPLCPPREDAAGCVLAPQSRTSFGFARLVQWTVGTLGVLLLVLLFLLGHEIEVLIGIAAAALAAVVTELLRPSRRPGRGGAK